MKKRRIITALLGLTLAATLASCGSKGDTGEKGDKGADGNGIVSVVKTGSNGLIDTYTITFENGTTTTFEIQNGEQGEAATKYYPVVFRNDSGDFLDADFVEAGSNATYHCQNLPEKFITVGDDEIYYEGSWDKSLNNIQAATNITYKFKGYARKNNKIYFGSYPQELVINDDLKEELNSYYDALPTSDELSGWTAYDYYYQNEQHDYTYYIDVDVNEDGNYDYRGVYFTEYRPSRVSYQATIDKSSQDDHNYLINNVYWFEYQPIEWNILKEEDGKALVLSNSILDAKEIYPTVSTAEFEHNGDTGYATNYKLSDIRRWLNKTFFEIYFDNAEQEIFVETLIDNSEQSTAITNNPYICDDTNDNIFLLSRYEATNLFVDSNARKAMGSDYAKCQGLKYCANGYSYWWTRSPYNANAFNFNSCTDGGGLGNYDAPGSTHIGVRPACWIEL